MIVISDSSSLIAIGAVGQLGLLRSLYGEVIVPPAAWSEVTTPNRPGASAVKQAGWIRVVPVSNPMAAGQLPSPVGRGEAEAIALAVELGADVLLIDERARGKRPWVLAFRLPACWAFCSRRRRMDRLPRSSRSWTRWRRRSRSA